MSDHRDEIDDAVRDANNGWPVDMLVAPATVIAAPTAEFQGYKPPNGTGAGYTNKHPLLATSAIPVAPARPIVDLSRLRVSFDPGAPANGASRTR